jgi:hypothetical protein
MVEVGARHADRPALLHQQEIAAAAALRARPVAQGRDDDQVRRAALPPGEPRPSAVRKLRRNPVSTVRALEFRISARREPEGAVIAGASQVVGLARLEAPVARPPPKASIASRSLLGSTCMVRSRSSTRP